ncbi:hypothetical protein Tco_1578899, partial [Tanacetum coccineum]
MFWHTARDDLMFNIIRVIFIHQDTQIYGAILPDVLTNQDMKDFEDYKLYYAVASGAEPPKAKTKYKKKADESDTSPKKNTAPATKGSRLKTSAKEAKSLATKRSKIQFRSSQASGSGDGADTQSEVPNEQQQKVGGTYEGAGDRPEVLDVPEYKSESEEESWTFSQGDDDDDDDDDDENDEHDLEDEKDDDDKNDSEETESDDDGYDFVHPNLSTYKVDDQEEEKADDDDKY